MNILEKEEITVLLSSDIVKSIRGNYVKEDYSSLIENFFRLILPREKKHTETSVSSRLRGCASDSGLADKTDKEIKSMMYHEKYGI
jgi:hypothetical protein